LSVVCCLLAVYLQIATAILHSNSKIYAYIDTKNTRAIV